MVDMLKHACQKREREIERARESEGSVPKVLTFLD